MNISEKEIESLKIEGVDNDSKARHLIEVNARLEFEYGNKVLELEDDLARVG